MHDKIDKILNSGLMFIWTFYFYFIDFQSIN
jgi:hypothetical protein